MSTTPLMFDGGSSSEIKECKHAVEEECTTNCTYFKFAIDGYNKGGTQRQDRLGFVRKVYGILLSQLALTALIVAAALNVDSLRGCGYGASDTNSPKVYVNKCIDDNGIESEPTGLISKMWVPMAIGAAVSLFVLICVPIGASADDNGQVLSVGKPIHMVVPYNYSLLLVFTICTSMVVSKISLAAQASNPGIVLEAVALTTAAVLGITIFAFTGFKDVPGVHEVSFIGPSLSAIGLIFGVTAFFVFAPNEKLGC